MTSTRLRSALVSVLATAYGASWASAAPIPFERGEAATFELSYLGMRAGVADVELAQDDRAPERWPITLRLRTYGLADRIFSIRQTFVSQYVPAKGRSLGHRLDSEFDGVNESEHTRYDGAIALTRRSRAGVTSDDVRDVLPGALDGLAALYQLRTLPLAIDVPFSLPIDTGHRSWMLEGRATGQERLETELGTFDTIVVRARTHFEGRFASDRGFKVWFTNDSRRLVVRVEAEFLVGSLVATARSWRFGTLAQK